jgi:hypothetical protein
MRAGGVSADGNLCERADSTCTRIVEEVGMAKRLRLIFAYPATVMSNGVALFKVQTKSISLKSKKNYFLEASIISAAKRSSQAGSRDVMPNLPFGVRSSASDGLKRFP